MYSGALIHARSNCRKKYGNDYQKWKEMRPDWLADPDIWNSMCDKFDTESWKQLSEQNSVNRKAPRQIVKHVSGTRSSFRHAKKMADENDGKPPIVVDVFRRTHVKRHTNEFVDAKSKDVAEKYAFYKANPQSPDEDDQEQWIRASGGVSHGRLYGVGSLINVSTIVQNKRSKSGNLSSCPPPSQPPASQLPVYTQEEVDAMMLAERRRNSEHFNILYRQLGLEMPHFPEVSSSAASAADAQDGQANSPPAEHEGLDGSVQI